MLAIAEIGARIYSTQTGECKKSVLVDRRQLKRNIAAAGLPLHDRRGEVFPVAFPEIAGAGEDFVDAFNGRYRIFCINLCVRNGSKLRFTPQVALGAVKVIKKGAPHNRQQKTRREAQLQLESRSRIFHRKSVPAKIATLRQRSRLNKTATTRQAAAKPCFLVDPVMRCPPPSLPSLPYISAGAGRS